MKTLKLIVNNECKDFLSTLQEQAKRSALYGGDTNWVNFELKNVDSKHFYTARDAKKVMNDYAVTKLPFVLLIDDSLPEDRQEYAAVYSEDGPITIERINEKL